MLLRAFDAWVSLGTLPWHSTRFGGRFQTCKSDNKLDWSTSEALSKSSFTEAKFVQLKGRGHKKDSCADWTPFFTTELLRWLLTVKSKRFQGSILHIRRSETTFTAYLLRWMLRSLFRSHDHLTFTVNGYLKLLSIKKLGRIYNRISNS